MFTLGAVEYTNAKPLIAPFELTPSSKLALRLDVPSRLPALLDAREADAVLASSFEALRTPGRTYAEGLCIATLGAAESVRLFSKKPFEAIDRLALDQSSMTSNHLALVLLAERYGVRPGARPEAPDLTAMLEQHDAALLIGDKGMEAESEGLHVLDLGQAWNEFTGLPFVWALWIGRSDLAPALVGQLQEALVWSQNHPGEVLEHAIQTSGWPEEQCERYLFETMHYELGGAPLRGLRAYHELLIKHGFLAQGTFPEARSAGVGAR